MNSQVIDFDTADKDALFAWAKENHPTENLGDKRQSLASLAAKCKKLAGVEDDEPPADDDEETDVPVRAKKSKPSKLLPKHITHLKHPVNGRVFKATNELWKRGDMIVCDKDGEPVARG